MPVQFKTPGTILFSPAAKVAMDAACCCETRPCEVCDLSGGHGFPLQMEIVIADIANGVECDECGNLNGTFICDYTGTFVFADGLVCRSVWKYYYPSPICGENGFLGVHFLIQSSQIYDTWLIQAGIPTVDLLEGGAVITFKKTIVGDLHTCDEFSDYDLPFVNGGEDHCDSSIATCKLTSL